jgi:hypothetical protein
MVSELSAVEVVYRVLVLGRRVEEVVIAVDVMIIQLHML